MNERPRPERIPSNLEELARLDGEVVRLLGSNTNKLFPPEILSSLRGKFPNLTLTGVREILDRLRDNGLVLKYEAWGPTPAALELIIKDKEAQIPSRITQRSASTVVTRTDLPRPVSSVRPTPETRRPPSSVPRPVERPKVESPKPAPLVRPGEEVREVPKKKEKQVRIKSLGDLGKHFPSD